MSSKSHQVGAKVAAAASQRPEDLRGDFEDEFRRLLREAYPADPSGRVVMPFRRIFAVAHKPAS